LSLEALWVTVIVINYVGRLTALRARHHTRERLGGSEVAQINSLRPLPLPGRVDPIPTLGTDQGDPLSRI